MAIALDPERSLRSMIAAAIPALYDMMKLINESETVQSLTVEASTAK
jgi:hypothetical protein